MSKAHMQLPSVEKKSHIDIVKNEVNSIKSMEDLKKMGEIYKSVLKLDNREVEELLSLKFIQSKMLSPRVALSLLIPPKKAPRSLNVLIQQLIPDFNSISKNIQNSLAYKYVETSLIIGEGQQLYDSGVITSMFSDNPAYFAGPYLFLLVSIKNPKCIDIFKEKSIIYTKDSRIDTMTLYHYGELLLLLNDFEKSEKHLLRAYKLAKRAKIKDLIEPIVDVLSLASFLNHIPFSVFCNYLKFTHHPSGFALNIWEVDSHDYKSKIHDKWEFYKYFEGEIMREHTRRVIFDYAETTTEMPIQLLYTACNNENTEEVLKSLGSSGELKFKIQDGVIKFIKHNYQAQIDCEQEKVDALLNLVKTK